jgi:hypothetical protein
MIMERHMFLAYGSQGIPVIIEYEPTMETMQGTGIKLSVQVPGYKILSMKHKHTGISVMECYSEAELRELAHNLEAKSGRYK